MTAKNISGSAPGGIRTKLIEVLPLSTPYVIQIFPVYACNFKCNYCIFSTPKHNHGFISNETFLDLNLYKKFIDDLTEFPSKLKVLRFVGIGEPLLHKNIVEMISYASQKNIANTIEILTNASLLTPSLTDSLISAGLNRIVISIQGTSAEKYLSTSNIHINFNNFISNIKYFYDHKHNCQIYIKIVDTALSDLSDKQKFYSIFSNICDTISIEHTVPIHPSITNIKSSVTQFGLPIFDIQICPQPFFTMQLNPDGNIVPCYSWDYPTIIGNCSTQSIFSIWNSPELAHFRLKHIYGYKPPTCKTCNIAKYRIFPEDILDNDIHKLKHIFK